MCKIPVVRIEQILNDTGKQIGIQYLDDKINLCDAIDKFAAFDLAVSAMITPTSSIILYRQDVKRLADKVATSSLSSTEVFRDIKSALRSKYTVLKLKYNPRSQEFFGQKTAFVLHYNDIND